MWPLSRDRSARKEAEDARLEACVSAATIKARNPEVHEVSSGLREFRDNNHFAERLLIIMRHERGTP